jgi:hypothetical protein
MIACGGAPNPAAVHERAIAGNGGGKTLDPARAARRDDHDVGRKKGRKIVEPPLDPAAVHGFDKGEERSGHGRKMRPQGALGKAFRTMPAALRRLHSSAMTAAMNGVFGYEKAAAR